MSLSSHATSSPASPAPIEVDQTTTDSANGGEEGEGEDNESLHKLLQFEWKYGRRYHSYRAGSYNFPNDDDEQARLDMVHHIYFRLLEDRLFLAPIDPNGLTILDIGTGTGIWPIHLGDEYPEANIVGNDLSPIQPPWVPPNVKFFIDDVELEWAEPVKYDYIHVRYMACSIKDWPRLVQQIYDNLKPGGWVEFQEAVNEMYSDDDTLQADNPMRKVMDLLREACDKVGRMLDPAPMFYTWAKDAGFRRVKEQRFKLPIGSWPKDPRLKEIGTLMGNNFFEGVAAFTAVPFADILGWKREEIEVLNAEVRRASRQIGTHGMYDFVVVTAQKPL